MQVRVYLFMHISPASKNCLVRCGFEPWISPRKLATIALHPISTITVNIRPPIHKRHTNLGDSSVFITVTPIVRIHVNDDVFSKGTVSYMSIYVAEITFILI